LARIHFFLARIQGSFANTHLWQGHELHRVRPVDKGSHGRYSHTHTRTVSNYYREAVFVGRIRFGHKVNVQPHSVAVCMCIYTYIHTFRPQSQCITPFCRRTYVYIYVHICTYDTYIYVHMYTYVRMNICIHMYTYIYVHICTYDTHICIHMYIYVRDMYTYVYIHICTYMYIRHAHTPTKSMYNPILSPYIYVCTHIFIRIYMYTYMYIGHAHTPTKSMYNPILSPYIYVYTHVFTRIYMYTYMYIGHAHTHTKSTYKPHSVAIYICIYIYTYSYVYTFIHICIHDTPTLTPTYAASYKNGFPVVVGNLV